MGGCFAYFECTDKRDVEIYKMLDMFVDHKKTETEISIVKTSTKWLMVLNDRVLIIITSQQGALKPHIILYPMHPIVSQSNVAKHSTQTNGIGIGNDSRCVLCFKLMLCFDCGIIQTEYILETDVKSDHTQFVCVHVNLFIRSHSLTLSLSEL